MRMAVYGITAHGFVKHVSEFWKTFLNTYVKICLILKKNVFSQLSVQPVGTHTFPNFAVIATRDSRICFCFPVYVPASRISSSFLADFGYTFTH